MWTIWCSDAEAYLCNRAIAAGLNVDRKRCLGRGRAHFIKRRMGMPLDEGKCARSAKTSKMGKLKRRLADLHRQAVSHAAGARLGASSFAMQHLWDKCRKAGANLVSNAKCDPLWHGVGVPCCSALHDLLDCVGASIQQQQLEARAGRLRSWKEKLASNWEQGGSAVYHWCKGECHERAEMISRADGSLTCDPDEMDSLVRDAWLPIFQMYRHGSAPS